MKIFKLWLLRRQLRHLHSISDVIGQDVGQNLEPSERQRRINDLVGRAQQELRDLDVDEQTIRRWTRGI